jgi:glutaredoxin
MNRITFFTKDGCHLCDAAWFVVNKLRLRLDFELERVDISAPGQSNAYALYCHDIPVVHLNGVEVFKHRVSERKLRELLETATPDDV